MAKRPRPFRLGLCTGGGDCPGLNAVIRAVVRHATLTHGWEVVGIRQGLTGLRREPPDVVALDAASVESIHETGGTVLGTNNKGSPFRKQDEAARAKSEIVRGWKTLGLDATIVVGGDGTQLMARRLVEAGCAIVGVPKTIDNDLKGSEQTVGFATAVEVAADAAARMRTTADAHDRVMIVEVMGRDSGFLALHAGLAAGADAILLPEIPFSYDVLARRFAERRRGGRNSWIIVVAEGATTKGGKQVRQQVASGAATLGGLGHEVAREIYERTGVDARCVVLAHLQRGGAPNAQDRILAARMGVRAVDLVAKGKLGRVVIVRDGALADMPYSKIGDERRRIDMKSDELAAAEAMGITLGR